MAMLSTKYSQGGGTPKPLSKGGKWYFYQYPRVLPDGQNLITGYHRRTRLFSRVTGKSKELIRADNVLYSPTGHLLFTRDRKLFAKPFSLKMLDTTGPEFEVIKEPILNRNRYFNPYYTIAHNGTLAYVPDHLELSSLVWVDRQGNTKPVAGASEGRCSRPHLSPDEKQLVLKITDEKRQSQIWKLDLSRGVFTQLTFESGGYFTTPRWIPPDGKLVSFGYLKNMGQMYSLIADRKSDLISIFHKNQKNNRRPFCWSPDGKYLAYRESESGADQTVAQIIPFGADGESGEPMPFAEDVWSLTFHPSGRNIAYCSNETGNNEIYIKQFLWGNLHEAWIEKVTSNGGTEPCWSHDGTKLYYRNREGMMEVAIFSKPDGTIEVGETTKLFNDKLYHTADHHRNYDVTSDEKFLMIKIAPPKRINIILNFDEELKRLAPTGKKKKSNTAPL